MGDWGGGAVLIQVAAAECARIKTSASSSAAGPRACVGARGIQGIVVVGVGRGVGRRSGREGKRVRVRWSGRWCGRGRGSWIEGPVFLGKRKGKRDRPCVCARLGHHGTCAKWAPR